MQSITIPSYDLQAVSCDVCVVGGGTGGVVAALAAARQGAKTVLIEAKGYVGGTLVEGGTALHSFFNNYAVFGRPRVQLVKGIPQQILDRLVACGGSFGHVPLGEHCPRNQDSVCTSVDTELYKLTAQQMLAQAGVVLMLETRLVGALTENGRICAVRVSTHDGEKAVLASAFIDCTGYGDLCAYAGAPFVKLNDYGVNNSIGVGGVSVRRYYDYILSHDALRDIAEATRADGVRQIVRLDGLRPKLPQDFVEKAAQIGLKTTTTCLRDDYLMFIKIEYTAPANPVDALANTNSALELRQRQQKAIALLRQYIPGFENAFIARTSPTVCIRRARAVHCDRELSNQEVTSGAHFDNEIGVFGYHDAAPVYNIDNGGCYGLPYDMLLPCGMENLFAAGMMLTPDQDAHMSTRNTVACMVQGQGAGVAAALISRLGCSSRQLRYALLRQALEAQDVCFDRVPSSEK